ncbi:MAG: hypothetical protein ABIQ01_04105 [Pseudolysinimonas sp.]
MGSLSRKAAAVFLASALAVLVGVAGPATAAPPVPSTVMTCSKLAAATNPPASFPVPVSQRYAPATETRHFPGIPSADVIRMAGGIVCEWSDGRILDGPGGVASVGIRVEYLPYAESGYWRWAAWGGITAPESLDCFIGYCQLMSAAGGDFLYIGIEGASSDAVASDLAAAIRVALQLGLKTPYVRPTYATELDRTCDQIVRPVVWRAAVASPVGLRTFSIPQGWSVVNSAMLATRAPACVYSDATGARAAGLMWTLPGGRWSFLTLAPLFTSPGPLTAISVPGMAPGDTAYTRCDTLHTHCILDALIATHWVQIDLADAGSGGGLIRTDRLAAMTPLLSEIVLQTYSP